MKHFYGFFYAFPGFNQLRYYAGSMSACDLPIIGSRLGDGSLGKACFFAQLILARYYPQQLRPFPAVLANPWDKGPIN